MGINREDILARQELQARADLMNETPPEVLTEIFATDDVAALNAYQWLTFDGEQRGPTAVPQQAAGKPAPEAPAQPITLLGNPLSPAFLSKYTDQTALFTHNKVEYDDPTEDEISGDEIVRAYIPRTRTGDARSNADATDVLRARRTTIALLRYLGASAARPALETPTVSDQAA